jgi:hypothetical protein
MEYVAHKVCHLLARIYFAEIAEIVDTNKTLCSFSHRVNVQPTFSKFRLGPHPTFIPCALQEPQWSWGGGKGWLGEEISVSTLTTRKSSIEIWRWIGTPG